jgi:hypothetical protein
MCIGGMTGAWGPLDSMRICHKDQGMIRRLKVLVPSFNSWKEEKGQGMSWSPIAYGFINHAYIMEPIKALSDGVREPPCWCIYAHTGRMLICYLYQVFRKLIRPFTFQVLRFSGPLKWVKEWLYVKTDLCIWFTFTSRAQSLVSALTRVPILSKAYVPTLVLLDMQGSQT